MKYPSDQTSQYVRALSILALLISLAVIVGWFFHVGLLKSVFPGYITMKMNAALSFVFLSVALLIGKYSNRLLQLSSFIICLLVIGMNFGTLAEYLLNRDFGIDQLFVKDFTGNSGSFPNGRLAPVTAVNFILLSFAMIADHFRNKKLRILSELFAALVLFASFQALVGYLIGLTYIFGSAFYTQMAVLTAVCFVLLSSGELLAFQNEGFVKSLVDTSHVSKLIRSMLFAAVFTPPIMKFVGQKGYELGWYDADFSQLIQVVGITGLLAVIIVSAGSALFKREIELKKAKEDAERSNALKSAFLANISHEMRTPLTAMIGYADLIRDAKDIDRAKYVDVIFRNAEQLGTLLNDIVDLSKVESGVLTIELCPININSIVMDVIELFRMQSTSKGIQIRFDPKYFVSGVFVSDPVRVKQVIINLLSNAIKFTDVGEIKIQLDRTFYQNSQYGIIFRIEDSGIGISPSEIEKIFGIFVQADGSMTRRFGGTGLGLALSHRLAHALGGDLKIVSSNLGRGSVFSFEIPNQISQ